MIGKQHKLRPSNGIYEDLGREGEDVSSNQTVNGNPILSDNLSACAWFLGWTSDKFWILIKLLKTKEAEGDGLLHMQFIPGDHKAAEEHNLRKLLGRDQDRV